MYVCMRVCMYPRQTDSEVCFVRAEFARSLCQVLLLQYLPESEFIISIEFLDLRNIYTCVKRKVYLCIVFQAQAVCMYCRNVCVCIVERLERCMWCRRKVCVCIVFQAQAVCMYCRKVYVCIVFQAQGVCMYCRKVYVCIVFKVQGVCMYCRKVYECIVKRCMYVL
jgi:hypothetical protein